MSKKPEGKTCLKPILPRARKTDIVIQEMSNEILIYDLEANRAHSLNTTAAGVWNHCDGTNSIDDIVAKLSIQTKTTIREDVVWIALDQLGERKLLVNNALANKHLETRREIIRKAGLASMVALPLISSIIAPKAASAQSVQSPCLPLNVCIGPSNICPSACNGRTIIYDLYMSNDGSCTNFQAANLPLACGPGGFFSVRDIMVTSA